MAESFAVPSRPFAGGRHARELNTGSLFTGDDCRYPRAYPRERLSQQVSRSTFAEGVNARARDIRYDDNAALPRDESARDISGRSNGVWENLGARCNKTRDIFSRRGY